MLAALSLLASRLLIQAQFSGKNPLLLSSRTNAIPGSGGCPTIAKKPSNVRHCSQTSSPGRLLGMYPSSPRSSTGAFGLGSTHSIWLGAPYKWIRMIDLAWPPWDDPARCDQPVGGRIPRQGEERGLPRVRSGTFPRLATSGARVRGRGSRLQGWDGDPKVRPRE